MPQGMIMKPDKITVHCSDTPNGKWFDVETIRAMHKAKGWKDVGYHLIIQPNGNVQNGRPLNEVGAHVQGANHGNIGICLIGRDKYTYRQFDSLHNYIHALQQSYDILASRIYCHYEFPSAIKQGKTDPNIRSAEIVAWYVSGDRKYIKDYVFTEPA